MSEDEIRAAYDAARTRADRLDELFAGLPLLPRIGRRRSADAFRMSAYGLTPPADGEWLPAVSVVTAPLRTAPELVPSTHIRSDAFPEPFERYVGRNRQLRSEGRFTIDAFGLIDEWVDENDDPQRPNVVGRRLRIYREGVCEWVHRYAYAAIPDPFAIPSTSFAEDTHNALAYFAKVYDTVGYAGRLAVFVRIDDADKAWLAVNQRLTNDPSRTEAGVEAVVAYRETTVDALLADPLPLVRDAMQLIWQAFGYSTCLLFDANGDWVPTG